MSDAGRSRKLAAEVGWGSDRKAVVWVGAFPLHHYWPLLAPYFSDVLLPPQRRMEGDTVAWSWMPEEGDPSAEELAALRRRLAADMREFADRTEDGGNRSDQAAVVRTMQGIVHGWTEMSDAELARYAARTANGLRVHGWSATRAPRVFDPAAVASGEQVSAAAGSDPGSPGAPRRRSILWLALLLIVAVIGAWFYFLRRPPAAAAATAPVGATSAPDVTAAASTPVTLPEMTLQAGPPPAPGSASSRGGAGQSSSANEVSPAPGAARGPGGAPTPSGGGSSGNNRAAIPGPGGGGAGANNAPIAPGPGGAGGGNGSVGSGPGGAGSGNTGSPSGPGGAGGGTTSGSGPGGAGGGSQSGAGSSNSNAAANNSSASNSTSGSPERSRGAASSAEPSSTSPSAVADNPTLPATNPSDSSSTGPSGPNSSDSNEPTPNAVAADQKPASPSSATDSSDQPDAKPAEADSNGPSTPNADSDAGAGANATAGASATNSSLIERPSGPSSPGVASPLRHLVLHRTPWAPVLLSDIILPTVPSPISAGPSQSAAALRDEQMAAAQKTLPEAYHAINSRQALLVTLPTGETLLAPWPGPALERRAPNGALLIKATFPSAEELHLATAPGVLVCARFMIRLNSPPSYRWQTRFGDPVPRAWSVSTTPTESILTIPLVEAGASQRPALFDPASGWALTTQLTLK